MELSMSIDSRTNDLNERLDASSRGADATVVVTCYSNPGFFPAALASVLAQTTTPAKIILHNNGCDKEYSALIEEAARGHDVDVISNFPNTYGLALRDHVLPKIATKYVAILHDDDLYMPDKMARSLAALETADADYVVTNRTYIDASDQEIHPEGDAINPRSLRGDEDGGQLIVDMLRPPGSRLHFSTLVLRTSIAQKTLLGDPFWPRIADAFFWVDLVVNESWRGIILKENLSCIRIHGQNDLIYEKFDPSVRASQFFLLSLSEVNLFQRILARASDSIIISFLREFAGITEQVDRVRALVEAAVKLDKRADLWLSKCLMVPYLVHFAVEADGLRAVRFLHEIAKEDANSFMTRVYNRAAGAYSEYYFNQVPKSPVPTTMAPLPLSSSGADGHHLATHFKDSKISSWLGSIRAYVQKAKAQRKLH